MLADTERIFSQISSPQAGDGAVRYQSHGRLLIIGDAGTALAAAARLQSTAARLDCTVLLPRESEEGGGARPRVIVGEATAVSGWLGEFQVAVRGAAASAPSALTFDLILDLGAPPRLNRDVPPPGYYAPGADAEHLERALEELPELVGTFEKPKYFAYDAGLCAHGRSGQTGCTRCLEACGAAAITSNGNEIFVDARLCQGCASCAGRCPTGAISFAYQPARALLETIRDALKDHRTAAAPLLVIRSSTATHEAAAAPIVSLAVESIGAIGIDILLAGLAYGAAGVLLLPDAATPATTLQMLAAEIECAQAILAALGYPPELLALGDGDAAPLLNRTAQGAGASITAAGFRPFDDKRLVTRLAIEHLYQQAPARPAVAALPEGAPFGSIEVDQDACTLCMGCVAVCPASALEAGDDRPALGFIEGNCVQCGMCRAACPEDAIRLTPRIAFDREIRNERRTLNEAAPLHCIVCGKPFASRSIVNTIRNRLAGHWMFQDPAARRRLEMCGDCRAKDIVGKHGSLAAAAGEADKAAGT